MRVRFCRLLLGLAERHVPGWIRCLALQILLNTTAGAFKTPAVRVLGMRPKKALETYMAYTRECMQRSGADGKRLYDHAYELGRRIRRITGFREQADLEELVFCLYRLIGISMSGRIPGSITVSACAFSRVYTTDQCRFMSNMDAGIIAGICGKGRLVFTERITEGCSCCRASFREKRRV